MTILRVVSMFFIKEMPENYLLTQFTVDIYSALIFLNIKLLNFSYRLIKEPIGYQVIKSHEFINIKAFYNWIIMNRINISFIYIYRQFMFIVN